MSYQRSLHPGNFYTNDYCLHGCCPHPNWLNKRRNCCRSFCRCCMIQQSEWHNQKAQMNWICFAGGFRNGTGHNHTRLSTSYSSWLSFAEMVNISWGCVYGSIQVQFNERKCMVKPYDAKMFLHSWQLFRVRAKGVEGDTVGVTPSGWFVLILWFVNCVEILDRWMK